MWSSFDKSRSSSIFSRMSAADKFEAERLCNRLKELMEREVSARAELTATVNKYKGSSQNDKIARDWTDIGIISAVVVARSPKMRKFVYDQAKDKVKDKVQKGAVKSVVDNGQAADIILKIIDIVSADTPWGAAYKAFDPFQSLGTGDDRPNEITYFEQKLSNVEEEYSNCFMQLMWIMDRYDRNNLIMSAQIQGPQLRAAP